MTELPKRLTKPQDKKQITNDHEVKSSKKMNKNVEKTSKLHQSVISIKSNLSKKYQRKNRKSSTLSKQNEAQGTAFKSVKSLVDIFKNEFQSENNITEDKEVESSEKFYKNVPAKNEEIITKGEEVERSEVHFKNVPAKYEEMITQDKEVTSSEVLYKNVTTKYEEHITKDKDPEKLYKNEDISKPDLLINMKSITANDQPSNEYKEKFIKFLYQQDYIEKIREEKYYDWPTYLRETHEIFKSVYKKKKAPELKMADFDFLKHLSAGSFGNVLLSMDIHKEQFYAIKIFNKKQLITRRHVDYSRREKEILESINFKFTVRLLYFFQNVRNLYFVLTLVIGEEFYEYLIKVDKINELKAKFYSSQIVLALEYLQNLNIVHRDLKPENIMMNFDGYLKLADFGFSKVLSYDRTHTFCGTLEYMAPELFTHQGYGLSVDWWSLGILIYEMCAGYTPFFDEEPLKIIDNITNCTFKVPKNFSNDIRKLLKSLLVLDVTKRYSFTLDSLKNIKNNIWFIGINWNAILNRTQSAPYKPNLSNYGPLSKIRHSLIDFTDLDPTYYSKIAHESIFGSF